MKAMGRAVKDSTTKSEAYDKEIREIQKELATAKESAEKLMNLAVEKVITKGVTYSEKMEALENKIMLLEDKLSKVETHKRAADISINSSQYLYSNFQFASEYLDEAPSEAQINLLKALIKALDVHEEHVIMRMYVGEPLEEIACEIDPEKKRTPPDTTGQGSPVRQQWRREEDSNL